MALAVDIKDGHGPSNKNTLPVTYYLGNTSLAINKVVKHVLCAVYY